MIIDDNREYGIMQDADKHRDDEINAFKAYEEERKYWEPWENKNLIEENSEPFLKIVDRSGSGHKIYFRTFQNI